jgi:hypothetical protein
VSFGKATGTVGVDVDVGKEVFVGNGVCVGVSVGSACVTVGEGDASRVGVSVEATFDGRLQDSIARMSIRIGNKVLAFIVSPLSRPSYMGMIPLAIGHLDSPANWRVYDKQKEQIQHPLFLFCSLIS